MTDYDRAVVIPGRSLTRSKAPGRFFPVGAGPHFCTYGHGAYLTATDGKAYLDMLCGLGAISLGYGLTGCEEGRAVADGGTYSLPSTLEAEAGEVMLQHVAPWASRVRFVKTGSESTHAAYRIAKHATGRRYVMVGDWSYHGWSEWSWRKPDGTPEDERTITYCHHADLWNWWHRTPSAPILRIEKAIEPEQIAAVFVEPHRWEPTDVGWLKSLRAWCSEHGIILVFDEMIYGGRWALGGASEFFGVTPDLACFGKALGNGAAIACVVGNEDLLEAHGQMVSGTFSGDTVGLAALIEVVGVYARNPVIETLWQRGGQLRRGLLAVCGRHPSLGAVVEGAGVVHQRLRFPAPETGQAFAAQMVTRGILWHPDCVNVCFSHTEAMIDAVIEAADASMAALEVEHV